VEKKLYVMVNPHTPAMLKNVCDEFVLCKNKKRLENKITMSEDNTHFQTQVQNQNQINEEESIYNELRNLDLYNLSKTEIKNIKWNQYSYYKEYKNKIYILRDTIQTIKLINDNRNLENKNLLALKDLLIRADSSFGERNWGFNNFKHFINSLLSEIVQTTFDQEKK
jgi:hypothetical protein